MLELIGKRIRLIETPQVTAYWRRNSPGVWFPDGGMLGTIIALPSPGFIGSGPQIRWDNGRITWLGSCSKYEVLS